LEISTPNWSEDPRMPIETIQSFLRQPGLDLPAQLAQQYRQQSALLAGVESRSLRRQLAQQRRLIWWKEELRDVSTHLYDLLRRLCLQLGRRLQEAGRIDSPADIFYLDYEALIALGRGLRVAEARELIAYNKAKEVSFRHFQKPDLIFPSDGPPEPQGLAADGHLRGIGVSPGSVAGSAWVIPALDQGQLATLPAGSILVTAYLNPAHIAFFPGLRAVVTANGGLLSHGAIMCRELGVPAVFGVAGVLEKIRSGDEIEVDGQAGVIALRRSAAQIKA
jgi:phosphohistidine swiveling domain-containing protein